MSIASEITRLQTAKADIKTSIEAKGITVPSSAKLDDYDTYVDQIQTGGGAGKLPESINNSITTLTASDFGSDTQIAPYKFMSCTSLTSVTIPVTITKIGRFAFWACTSLTSITYQGTTTQWGNVELGNLWSFYSNISTIHCTDGDVNLINDSLNYIHLSLDQKTFIPNYGTSDLPTYTSTSSPAASNDISDMDGDYVWWNGESLQANNILYDPITNNKHIKGLAAYTESSCKSSKGLFTYGGNIYTVTNGNSVQKAIWKYNATASHADNTTDYWTKLTTAHHPMTSTSTSYAPICRLGNDIYLGDATNTTWTNLYKWLNETDGFDTTPMTLPFTATEFRTWNIWTPDEGQHYFLSGSANNASSTTLGSQTYLWNDTTKQFDLWAENYGMYFQGVTCFSYGGDIYCQGNPTGGTANKFYKMTIDYTNKTFTFTDVDSQFLRIFKGPYTDGYWDKNGTRCLCCIMVKPRKTN